MTMYSITRTAGCAVALLLFGCGHSDMASAQDSAAGVFVGSSPGGTLAREFLGGLAPDAPCHSIMWQLTLSTNQNPGAPATYGLTALYQIPTRSNTNQSEDGPKVALRGRWEIIQGVKSKAGAAVYRIHAENPQRSLSFVKVGGNLLHLLDPDGSLAIGNGGWSYTLNRADYSEKPVERSLAMSAPDMSYKISAFASGPEVFGVFEGRSPCQGIARELKLPQHAGCMKAKWRVTFYQNPETSAPKTYKVEGTLFREHPREGTWSIIRGATTDPNATVYQLNATNQSALFLLKGDGNVLFFLNQDREPMVGHAEFSYTLNRAGPK